MPRVARLSIAPVRSLGLQHPTEVDLSETGVVEDRRFFLADERNRLIDRLIEGPLVQIAATTDPEATRLRLAFPDGTTVDDDVRLGAAIETPIHGRTGVGHVVEGPWGRALSDFTGRQITLVRCDRPGGTRVGNPTSLIGDGSIRRLARQLGVEELDGRRFRMLMELEGAGEHEEDSWIGRELAVGGAVLRVTMPDARCAITTQDPDTGVRDLDTLRGIIAYRGLREGKHADLGVLADVVTPGRVAIGDEIVPLGPRAAHTFASG
jgi:uncharacterized protein YcbX